MIIFFVIFLSQCISAFNFQVTFSPYLFFNEIPFLSFSRDKLKELEDKEKISRISFMQEHWLWHENFLTKKSEETFQELSPLCGKGIFIAVIDSCVSNSNNSNGFVPRIFSIETACLAKEGFLRIETHFEEASEFIGDNRKRFAQLMKKNTFYSEYIKKNHGAITCSFISQYAPFATIIMIPIFDEYGFSTKEQLYKSLLKAYQYKIDIVHLGLQIYDFDISQLLDAKIITLLKKFPYVVASAGNNASLNKLLAYPAACENIISVGSFYKNSVCSFSQGMPQFLMPGKNLITPFWIDFLNENIMISLSGTSFSAALMTGYLALLLAENRNKLSRDQIMQLLYFGSHKLDETWNNKTIYGYPNFYIILKTLHRLISLKRIKKYTFCKNFMTLLKDNYFE